MDTPISLLPATVQRKSLLKKIIFSLLVFHFFLCFLGALERRLFTEGPLSVLEDYYGEVTGSNGGFKFFAPNVGTDPRVIFKIHSSNGPVSTHVLGDSRNRESDLRIKSIINQFWEESDNEKMRRSLTASWAGKMFTRFPQSQWIEVKVQSYFLPTMADWRKGARPAWEDFYKAKFVRSK